MEEEEDGGTAVPSFSGNPLLRAVFLRRLRLTRLLLEGGAYVNESDGRGQTPLMVACGGTRHADAQSVSRVKLVRYLLERGADPNIQDTAGRSSLMHACLERAGAQVVALLLAGGADPGLEDRCGTSALVYAVTAGDQEALKLLLDTCKARGKEVIIIATDMFPCGQPRARQYLDVSPPLPQGENTAPASPSEIDLLASSPRHASGSLKQDLFSFKETTCSGCSGPGSQPCSPSRLPGWHQGRADALRRQQPPLHRLNSEPWLRIPASLLTRQPGAAGPATCSTENLPDLRAEEEEDLCFRRNRLGWNAGRGDNGAPRRRCDCCCAGPEGGGAQRQEAGSRRQEAGEGKRADLLGHDMCSLGLLSCHSASHPNLHSQSLSANSASSPSSSSSSSLPAGRTLGRSLHNVAMSSLHSILQRRMLGGGARDHYGSDPQLAAPPRGLLAEENKRGAAPEAPSVPPRRVLPGLERRGSGTLLLDHLSQARPGPLPPLCSSSHHQTPPIIPNITTQGPGGGRGFCGGAGGGPKTLFPPVAPPPGHPPKMEPSRRTLQRRFSMQAEQLAQLGDFHGICSH